MDTTVEDIADQSLNDRKADVLNKLNSLVGEISIQEAAELARNGNYLEAENLLLQSAGNLPSTASLDLLARIAVQQGKIEIARDYWKQALSIDPACLIAQQGLTELSQRTAPRYSWNKWITGGIGLFFIVFFAVVLLFQANKLDQLSVQLINFRSELQKTPVVVLASSPSISLSQADLAMLQATLIARQDSLSQQLQTNQDAVNSLATSVVQLTPEPTPVPDDPYTHVSFQVEGIELTRVNETLEIHFDQGIFLYGTVLSPFGRDTLRTLGFQLAPYLDQFQVEVIAFGDDQEANLPGLSLDRGTAVVKYLHQVSQTPDSSLRVVSSTNRMAPFPNNSWENRARNRTAILILTVK